MQAFMKNRNPKPSRLAPNARHTQRRGAAAVEMALITPLLGMMIIGMLEMSCVGTVKASLGAAARKGTQVAVLPLSDNATVISNVNAVLTDRKINSTSATITILVNNLAVDVSTAKTNDKITVKVSIPYSKIAWTTSTSFMTPSTIVSESVAMMRQ